MLFPQILEYSFLYEVNILRTHLIKTVCILVGDCSVNRQCLIGIISRFFYYSLHFEIRELDDKIIPYAEERLKICKL